VVVMARIAFLRRVQTVRAPHRLAAALFALAATIGSPAGAVYYSATLLPIPGFTSGQALDTSGATRQVGFGRLSGVNRALMWDGTSANPVDMTPAGYLSSALYGTSGANQAGSAGTSGPTSELHAMVWGTTAASAVDLHPASGYFASEANAVYGNSQVGYGQIPGGTHALLWNGTAASKVDLHPSGFTSSIATDVYTTKQVGWARLANNNEHAMLWTGTAASRVDLNPSGYITSRAYSIYGTGPTTWKQVGYAAQSGGFLHAMMWSSTAASRVDLHPDASLNFLDTEVFAGSLAGQVGYGRTNEWHAAYWNGTAASCVDLNKYLGGVSNFNNSQAFGIADDGTIVGEAWFGTFSNPHYPVMWKPVTESGVPGDYNNDGTVDAGDYIVWRKYNGTNYLLMNEVAGTTPGSVSPEDFTAWNARFGNTAGAGQSLASTSVPEPATASLLLCAICAYVVAGLRPSHSFRP
jgi:hypothetical protein